MKHFLGYVVIGLFLEAFIFSWIAFGTVDFKSKESMLIQALRNWAWAHLFLGVCAAIALATVWLLLELFS